MYDLVIRNATIVDGSGDDRFTGDVAVSDGVIEAVARSGDAPLGAGKKEIDAGGDLLTPGFVDIHTRYDGQVCWDKQVTPSCWHGVTTVVMGNCGVGFAPVHPGTEDELVSLMESVEDIPGTALHEGIPWGWKTFPEYLDAIDTPYAVDVRFCRLDGRLPPWELRCGETRTPRRPARRRRGRRRCVADSNARPGGLAFRW